MLFTIKFNSKWMVLGEIVCLLKNYKFIGGNKVVVPFTRPYVYLSWSNYSCWYSGISNSYCCYSIHQFHYRQSRKVSPINRSVIDHRACEGD
jgi:hypothetical protein